MVNVKKFWNKTSKNYDSMVNLKYAEAYNKTIKITKKYLKNTDIVLDYACGTGITTIEISRNVKKISAIDISENMISVARKKTEEEGITNVEFNIADIYDEKLKKGSFDVIMAFNILYFIKDIDNVLARINELLKPGGTFISVTDCLGEKKTFLTSAQYLLSKLGVIPYIRRFKVSELRETVEEGDFSIIEAFNLYDCPPNYYIAARKK
ncbi:methyltransferase domain-containing protein [Clostridium sediminicola]|uniref:class I SAM-dependent methyltransferase n=1 Tax=Clostridium sediminicola TaxID=3114879 RepID=UPI0031F22F92